MKYRPDIDGLRAVAIILVLIYHGGLALFPSGFVGVDIFFVISGFLITTIIHSSLNNDNFSFIDFYNRRLWRLQPVLVCLLLLTTVLTAFFYLPEDLVQFTRSARKTTLFVSNVFFNSNNTGYFAPDSHQLPLLHTWSLSIEWQCYLILPIIMYGLHQRLSKRNVIVAIYALTIICFMGSIYNSNSAPALTYYKFSSRIFEFLVGSCIALTPIKHIQINKYLINIIGFVALIIIFYIATLDKILMDYPNWYAFAICIATGVLIFAGTFYPEQKVIKFLSFKPLVFIGVLSYSLYIWHWVLFAMLSYQNISKTPVILALSYGAIFILAYLSWRHIEKPSRQLKHIKFRYTLVYLLLLPILFTHLCSFLIKNHSGFPQRFNQELVTIYQKIEQYDSTQRPLCIDNKSKDVEAQCRIGSNNAPGRTGFLIGDSFSNHYWGFMDTLGKESGVSILAQGTSACLALPGLYLYDWWTSRNKIYQNCFDNTEKFYGMIQKNHYDFVIIGQFWNFYFSDNIINQLGEPRSVELSKQRLKTGLDKALKIITDSGAKPVLFKSIAQIKGNFYQCFYKHIKLRRAFKIGECDSKIQISENDQWLENTFNEMKIKYPQLILIDPKKVQCHNKICTAVLNGVPIYRNAEHINDYASYQLGKMYLKSFGNPLT